MSASPQPTALPRQEARRGAKPTIEDVARAAGVSRGTVSRVLNGGHYVSPDAAQAVRAAVRRIGYVANQSARSLASRRTNCYAFVLSEPQAQLFEDPNVATLLRSTTAALAEQNATVVLMFAASAQDNERVRTYVRAGHVDGVMLASTHADDPLARELVASGVPTVRCGPPFADADGVPWVSADDRGGARQMVRHLVERGRRQIGIVTGPLDAVGSRERRGGWADVLGARADDDLAIAAELYSHEAGRRATEALLAARPDVDAIFAASDLLAGGAMEAVLASGRTVPNDVAVGGFDDSRIAASLYPPLTTVRQPVEQVGAELARLLARIAAGEPPVNLTVPVELVVRAST